MKPKPSVQPSGTPLKKKFDRVLHSINTQLITRLLASTLIPLFIVTAINSRSIGREIEAAGSQAMASAAQQTAMAVDAFIEKGLYHGTAAAALPELHDYFKNPKKTDAERVAIQNILKSISQQNPVFIASVTLSDPQGKALIASLPEEMESSHDIIPDLFTSSLETGQSSVSPVHFDAGGKAYTCFYSPVMENGKPVGILRISYSAAILQQLTTKNTGLLGPESFPILLDDNHLQIAHGVLPHGRPEELYILWRTNASETLTQDLIKTHRLPPDYNRKFAQGSAGEELSLALQKDSNSQFFTTRLPITKDRAMAASTARLAKAPWTVVFFQPRDILDLPIDIQKRNTLLLGGLLAGIAILMALWVAHTITAPIMSLTQTAQKAVQEVRPLPLKTRARNEVGQLADAFNRLFEVLDKSRQELISSEEHLKITLNSIGDGVITTDTDGRITSMNPAAEAIIEQPLSGIKGKLFSEVIKLLDASTRQPLAGIAEEALATSTTLSLPSQTVLITVNDNEKFITDSAAPIRDSWGRITGCVLVFRDTTERHRLENNLIQGRKMKALGQLASGVAHDFNNMLTPILGAAQILEGEDLAAEERKKCASMIVTAAKRASALTQQMLAFSRETPVNNVPVDLCKTVQESLSILQHSIGTHISIRTHCPINQLVTTGDAAQIQNVFLNLALNARDAMPERGVLTFKLKQTLLDEEYCRLHSCEVNPGPYIEVQVSDTGSGMDADTLSKIFEPFSTTKEAGKESGLGLASVYGIMKTHRGFVTAYSEKGRGTVFHLYFPETKASPEIASPEIYPAPSGKGHILLIDDEESVREITRQLLETLGYTAQCADGGAAGLKIYQDGQDSISAVLLDLMMPGLSGEETFSRLRQINPSVKVILMSGFDADGATARLLSAGADGFIQKPFQKSTLAKAFQNVFPNHS